MLWPCDESCVFHSQHYENIWEVVKPHICLLCSYKAAPQSAMNDAESNTETPMPEFQVTITSHNKTIPQFFSFGKMKFYILLFSYLPHWYLNSPCLDSASILSPTQSQIQTPHVMTSNTMNMTPTHVMTGLCELRRSGLAFHASPHTRWTWPCCGWPTLSEILRDATWRSRSGTQPKWCASLLSPLPQEKSIPWMPSGEKKRLSLEHRGRVCFVIYILIYFLIIFFRPVWKVRSRLDYEHGDRLWIAAAALPRSVCVYFSWRRPLLGRDLWRKW